MKKHDEGYALVLVLVVMLVLCLVATSVLTIALNNLKKQETSVARMKAKYEAQGKIEEFYARVQSEIYRQMYVLEYADEENEGVIHPATIAKVIVTPELLSIINQNVGVVISGNDEEKQLGILKVNDGDTELRIRIEAYGDGLNDEKQIDDESSIEQVRITCVLVLKTNVPIKIDDLDEQGDGDPENDVVYWLVDPVLSYSEYEVTVVTPEKGGDGQ